MIRSHESKAGPVGVLAKVLRVLEALDASPNGLPLRNVASQTGLNKSTAYRLLAHLEGEGYLFRDDVGVYIVGPKLARLGSGVSYHATLRSASRPVIQQLWSMTTETVNLAVRDGLHVLYLDVMESSHTFRLASQVGMRRPLHCTALGKAILAFSPAEERDGELNLLRLERVSKRTITSLPRFRRELAKVMQHGYAVDDEEAESGARCASAPIFDRSGKVAGAISVSGPVTRVNYSRLQMFAHAVRDGARLISQRLGYDPAKATAAVGLNL
jgi:DNA-binding IclR family transcriptional regulator